MASIIALAKRLSDDVVGKIPRFQGFAEARVVVGNVGYQLPNEAFVPMGGGLDRLGVAWADVGACGPRNVIKLE